MAHEIDQTTNAQGSAMFAYKPAWHGLGTVVQEAQSSREALRLSGLDWDVNLTDLAADFGNDVPIENRYKPLDTHRATYRMDTGVALGAVGMRYRPLQNREAFAWMDEVVGRSGGRAVGRSGTMRKRWNTNGEGYWAAIHRRLAWIERRLQRCRRIEERMVFEEERFDLLALLDDAVIH